MPEPSAAIERGEVETMQPVVQPTIGGTAARIAALHVQGARTDVGHEAAREARSQNRKRDFWLEVCRIVVRIAAFEERLFCGRCAGAQGTREICDRVLGERVFRRTR